MEKFNPEKTKQLNKINKVLALLFHSRKAKSKIEWNRVNRILVVDMTLIGDTVMLIPLLKVLKRNAPEAKIDLVCGNWGQTILCDQELVQKFYILSGKKIESPSEIVKNSKDIQGVLREIRKTTYDVIIEPRGDLRYIFFMYWLRGKRKVSYNYTGGETLLTDVVVPNAKLKHLVDDKLYLLSQVGCQVYRSDRIPCLHRTKRMKEYADEFMSRNNISKKLIVGIHPGASLKIKEWTGYPEFVSKISQTTKKDLFFIIFSGPGEEQTANIVSAKAEENELEYVLSKTSLEEYINILSFCDYVICNDSGAGHIGAAFGAKVISIMGPFSPEFCAPLGENVRTLSIEIPCKPCMARECKIGTNECISGISTQQVLQEWESLFSRTDERMEYNA